MIDRRVGDAADILRYADMALYRAKNEGRNRACIYDAAMDADLSNRKLLEGDLLQAIKTDGLRAAYQPIVNVSGDTVVGVEALARWTHPTHGEIPPSRFIPIAEHSGLIIELGEWMLRRACLDGRNWPGLLLGFDHGADARGGEGRDQPPGEGAARPGARHRRAARWLTRGAPRRSLARAPGSTGTVVATGTTTSARREQA